MLTNDVNPKTLSRIELLKLAQTLRVTDADVMTRAELRAAIERARAPEARQQLQPVSWLGKARRLLASVVERGLHLPEAATLIRGGLPVRPFQSGPPPVATVTLARIYAAQGHLVRAIGILDEVLVSDPDHELARSLREELQKLLDQRKEQERRQQQSNSATAAPQPAAAETEPEEAPPSEAQLAPSELLGAVPPVEVPELEVPSTDEITLAGTGAELRNLQPRERAQGTDEASELRAEPSEAIEPEAETRRASDLPASEREHAAHAAEGNDNQPASAAAAAQNEAAAAPEPTAPAELAAIEAPAAPREPAPEQAASEQLEALSTNAAAVAPEAAVEPPHPAGLVLIETSERSAYLYWELATPAAANGSSNGVEPHWVCVVTHTPRGARSERREYRFPVQRAAGAVRIEGLPKHAVVRAKLTRGEAQEAPALVVAGSVRVGCTAGGCDGSALQQAQPGFLPHPAADPARLAQRAATHLASAAPLYC